jgi:hypothetical protein
MDESRLLPHSEKAEFNELWGALSATGRFDCGMSRDMSDAAARILASGDSP